MRPALLVLTLALPSVAAAQGKSIQGTSATEGATVSDPHKARLLEEIAKTATPGPQHRMLKVLEGKWITNAKLWFGAPKPEQASGHDEAHAILGDRFIEDHYDSVVWGKPYAGQGLLGFDERAQKFVLAWVDTWGTWVTVAEGTADASGKTITLTTRDYDDATAKTRPVKFVITIDSNDHHVRRTYEKVQGKETLTMEIEYKRKK